MSDNTFNKDNLDMILKELAKEYRRLGGKAMPAEIILIGGAAIIENYGFRDMTTDIDAIIKSASMMKDAINTVGDRLNLPRGWLNDDFKRTTSFSPRISEISTFYKTFYGVLNVRTVAAEYLIAMKLKAGRKYKNDLSDIVGILAEHKKRGNEIRMEQIDTAVKLLYGGWEQISSDSYEFINTLLIDGNYDNIAIRIKQEEKDSRNALLEFQEAYPDVTNSDNMNTIADTLTKHEESRAAVLEKLRRIKELDYEQSLSTVNSKTGLHET